MTHDEFIEIIRLSVMTKDDLSRMLGIDPRRLNDSITGYRDREWYKIYEDKLCQILEMRARVMLMRLAEYGHGDK